MRQVDHTAVTGTDAPGREQSAHGGETSEHVQSHVAGWLRRLFGGT